MYKKGIVDLKKSKIKKNLPRALSEEEINSLYVLEPNDVTKKLLIKYFAKTLKDQPRYKVNDFFTLPKGKLGNDKDEMTTIGRYIFNLFVLKPTLLKYTGYINKPLTDSVIDKEIDKKVSDKLLRGDIKPEVFIDYLNRIQWLAFTPTDFIIPGMAFEFVAPNKKIMKERDRLIAENREEFEGGNEMVGAKIEKQLDKFAKETLDSHPSMNLFKSGSKPSFGNNYKSNNIMKGPVVDNSTGKFHNISSCYGEGIKIKDFANMADTIVYAAHSRAIGTQDGGYETKKMFSAFQNVVLDKEGTDCGTTKYVKVHLTEENYDKLFKFKFVLDGGKLVELNEDTYKKYIGTTVKMRSIIYCQTEKLCNKCAGNMYYYLDLENIGLSSTRISTSLLNLSLKNFHDTTMHVTETNYLDYITEV